MFDGKLWGQKINNTLEFAHGHITALNGSKIFAGMMIIVLNIASRFVTIKLSKTMESYLKYTFSRQALIFAIAWMGTRDIYIALIITLLFSLFVDVLFNEDSRFCVLPSTVTEYYTNLSESNTAPTHQNVPGMPPQMPGSTMQQGQSGGHSNPSAEIPMPKRTAVGQLGGRRGASPPAAIPQASKKQISDGTITNEEMERAKDVIHKWKLQHPAHHESFYKTKRE